MKLDIVGQHLDMTEVLAAHIERRLRFTLGRFGSRIGRVAVTLTTLEGSRGGLDKQCCIVASLAPTDEVVVDVIDTDIFLALDRATDRLGRILARELERRREQMIRPTGVARVPAAALFRRQPRTPREEGGVR